MEEKRKPRVLITTCSHGSGHRMVAETLKEKYSQFGCDVEIFDVFNTYNRVFNVIMEKLYLLSYKPFIENIYGKLYYKTSSEIDSTLDKIFYPVFNDLVINYINGYKPDLIVNTYNHRSIMLTKDKYFKNIPLVNIVTEFTLPSFWLHPNVDKYFLATEKTKELLVKNGIEEDKAIVSGIPVRNDFFKELNKKDLEEKYQLSDKKMTLVIFAGTFGVLKNLKQLCREIDKIDGLQTLVVCGLNHRLYKKLTKCNFKNIKILRYISSIEEIYKLADFMITKPGGTVLSEAVITGVPIILFDPVPGQESENAQILVDLKAASIARDTKEAVSEVISLMEHPQKLKDYKESLLKLSNGDPSEIIVKDSLALL